MANMTNKPNDIPWVSPYIMVKDVQKAVDFYVKAFNFAVKEVCPGEDGIAIHAELTYNGQLVMLGKQGAYGGNSVSPESSKVESPITMYVYTDNVDEFYKHAKANQAVGHKEPEDTFWGDRMCVVQDPDGYVWSFATRLAA